MCLIDCIEHSLNWIELLCGSENADVTRNTKLTSVEGINGTLWNESHLCTNLSDNTNPDNIVNDGYYNVYTTINGKKYRWILHNKTVSVDNSIFYRIQTAYYYMGAESSNIHPLQRNIYYYSSGETWGFTPWIEI